MVDEVASRRVARHLELLGGGGDRGDVGTEHGAELHGGEADAAAGTEHHQFFARLQSRHRTEHVIGGAVRHPERGRVCDRRHSAGPA